MLAHKDTCFLLISFVAAEIQPRFRFDLTDFSDLGDTSFSNFNKLMVKASFWFAFAGVGD
jgi:hypothetical protein